MIIYILRATTITARRGAAFILVERAILCLQSNDVRQNDNIITSRDKRVHEIYRETNSVRFRTLGIIIMITVYNILLLCD